MNALPLYLPPAERKGRTYIAGPMTGRPDLNRQAFAAAESWLRQQGMQPISPVRNGLTDAEPWAEHMRADLVLLTTCDAIAMLPGWLSSKGARLEQYVAQRLGLHTILLPDWIAGAELAQEGRAVA